MHLRVHAGMLYAPSLCFRLCAKLKPVRKKIKPLCNRNNLPLHRTE